MKRAIVLIAVAAVFCALPANGALITIEIEAVVHDVHDSDNYLEGKVNVGDSITGIYTYDTDTPDMDWLWGSESDAVARYHYFNPPYGISLSVGELDFMTDPANTNFLIEIVNDRTSIDAYSVISYNNLPFLNGTKPNNISWNLRDYSENAILSTELPTAAPVLDDWGVNRLNISGGPRTGGFTIEGHVISAIPEPTTIVLLGLGGLVLRKRR